MILVTDLALRLQSLGFFRNRGDLLMEQGYITERKVIVLIDEYDSSTSYSVQHKYFPEVYLTWMCKPEIAE